MRRRHEIDWTQGVVLPPCEHSPTHPDPQAVPITFEGAEFFPLEDVPVVTIPDIKEQQPDPPLSHYCHPPTTTTNNHRAEQTMSTDNTTTRIGTPFPTITEPVYQVGVARHSEEGMAIISIDPPTSEPYRVLCKIDDLHAIGRVIHSAQQRLEDEIPRVAPD